MESIVLGRRRGGDIGKKGKTLARLCFFRQVRVYSRETSRPNILALIQSNETRTRLRAENISISFEKSKFPIGTSELGAVEMTEEISRKSNYAYRGKLTAKAHA